MYQLLLLLPLLAAGSPANYQRSWSGVACGRSDDLSSRDLTGKIVGGQVAEEAEFPWQVSLRSGSWHFCGGTVISKDWILTASHCVSGKGPSSLNVVTHAHARLDAGVSHKVAKIIMHPDFSYWTLSSDIALIKLQSPLEFDDYVQPACAPSGGPENYYKDVSVVSGWGTTQSGGASAKHLMWVALPIPSNKECQDSFNKEVGRGYTIDDTMLCAGRTPETEFDACQGDSGGPMVVNVNGCWEVVGAVSWGYSCAAGPPGVYANVPYFYDWVSEQLAKN